MFSRRTPSLLLTLCTFIALWLVNVGAFAHAHTRAGALLHGAHATLAIDMPAGHAVAASEQDNDADACGDCLAMEDSDADDEPMLLLSASAGLNYLAPAAPAGADAAPCNVPPASLLRPPRIA